MFIVSFLSHRLLFSRKTSNSIRVVALVCFASLTIGTLALSLILSIMQGFEIETEKRLQSIHPQVTFQSSNLQFLNHRKIDFAIKKKFPQVIATAPSTTKYGLIKSNDSQDLELNNIISLRAVSPKYENLISPIESKIISKHKNLATSLDKNKILIGTRCAEELMLDIGDEVTIFIPISSNDGTAQIEFEELTTIVGDIFKTGIVEFDQNLAICSLEFLQKNLPDCGITEIGLKHNCDNEKLLIQNLRKHFKIDVTSWREQYTAVVSALKLEKYVSFAIISLIIIIASMNLIALLFMLITQYTSTIATLHTLGLSLAKIKNVFTVISLIITASASALGLFLCWIFGTILKHYNFIELPDAYYVSTLPVHLSLHTFLFVFLFSIIIALIGAQIPIRRISKLNMSNILRSNN